MIRYFLIFSLGVVVHLFARDVFYYNNGKKIDLSPVDTQNISKRSDARIPSATEYYKTPNDTLLGVSNQLIIKFKNLDSFKEIVNTYKLTLLKEIYKNTYLFKVDALSDTLDISNQIYKLKSVKFAHPNFIRKAKER